MRRREFIGLLGGAAAWPLAARAQQPATPVVGLLGSLSAAAVARPLAALRQSLKEIGYEEGKTLVIEYRWAEGRYGRLPDLAADLARRQVAAIVTVGGDPPALGNKQSKPSEFVKAVEVLRLTCNNCHFQAGVGFIHVGSPHKVLTGPQPK
jgi:putative ABC transport system substrate-binding protein